MKYVALSAKLHQVTGHSCLPTVYFRLAHVTNRELYVFFFTLTGKHTDGQAVLCAAD